MKSIISWRFIGTLALSLAAVMARAQSTVSCVNFGTTWAAPWFSLAAVDPTNQCAVFGANAAFATEGNTLLAGTGYTAELWAGVDGGWMWETQPLARTTFRTGTSAGLLGAVSQVPVIFATPGQRIIYQLRVWENMGGTVTSWDEVINTPAASRGNTPVYTSSPLAVGPNTLEFREAFVMTPGFAAPAPVLAMTRDGCKRYTGFEAGIPIPSVHAGEDVTFSVVCPTPAASVQWRFEGANIPGATSNLLSRPRIQISQAGLYTAVVTATNGARTARMTNSISLTVLPAPRLVQPRMHPTQGFSAIVDGVTDRMVQLESSSDLQVWTPGPTQMIEYAWGCGCLHNTLTIPPPLPPDARFYRVRLLP